MNEPLEFTKLNKELMLRALSELSVLLIEPMTLIVGGGGAMVMAYDFPLATTDLDAIPKNSSLLDIEKSIKRVATNLGITPDWLNPYFSAFTYVLPLDYSSRLRIVFKNEKLLVQSLGPEDLLLMKCFARRAKDLGHIRSLLKLNPDLKIVFTQLESLVQKKIKGASEALAFLDEFLDQES